MEQFIQLDHSLFSFINQGLSNSFFDWIMPLLREKRTWIPFYLIGVVLIARNRRWRSTVLIVLCSIAAVGIADGVSSHLLKPYFARTRPCLLPEMMNQVNLLVSRCSGAFSFPSSHAANHIALALFLGLVFKKSASYLLPFFLVWAVLIGFAQIYVGVHFPSDILAGFLLGLFCGFLVYLIYRILTKRLSP